MVMGTCEVCGVHGDVIVAVVNEKTFERQVLCKIHYWDMRRKMKRAKMQKYEDMVMDKIDWSKISNDGEIIK